MSILVTKCVFVKLASVWTRCDQNTCLPSLKLLTTSVLLVISAPVSLASLLLCVIFVPLVNVVVALVTYNKCNILDLASRTISHFRTKFIYLNAHYFGYFPTIWKQHFLKAAISSLLALPLSF